MGEPADLTAPHTWLQVARIKLEHARQILDINLYDDAISRAYYAMFYAAKAALLTEGLDLRKHSATIAKFREIFVITGKVEAEYLHYLGRAQGARERSDYVPFILANREDAIEILATAEAFVTRIESIVETHIT